MIVCKICSDSRNIELDARAPVPIAQNLIMPTITAALNCPSVALDMRRCKNCGFVWNAKFDAALMVYDATYDNDQNFSTRFQQHTAEVADRIANSVDPKRLINLVEVGCGQGTFMDVLGRRFGGLLRSAIGYDPSWQGDTRHLPPGGEVRGEYFTSASLRVGDPPPDVVVSRHVIEHVPDPLKFLRAIRAGMTEGTPLCIETPDVDWVLRGGVFFDFYYEHCSLFGQHALALALERSGFIVDEIRPIFDDQYQLAMAVAGPIGGPHAMLVIDQFDDLGFCAKRTAYLDSLAATIDGLGPSGAVALWGGASKAVTICLTLPRARDRLACVIDINERKQGCFLPTTGIPILSPASAVAAGIQHAIVVNPAYLDEIRADVARQEIDLNIVSITETMRA